ncbi:unannotated protein [freshwater metagenome]|uniref:Unannotated protein n=1 Tax=freshwater metagenome TaxID=449393 RepID=A0A6J6HWL0_9ZZZZ|nr:hypothetical protein [Actinomycetota bacterium]
MTPIRTDTERDAPRWRLRSGTIIGGAVALAGSSAAGLLALSVGTSAASTTLTVDTLDDGAANATDCSTPVANSCSLRDAVAAIAAGDTITFAPGLTGTITLTNGEFLIGHGVTISGPGSADLAIDAGQTSRIFTLNGSDLYDDMTLSGLTLENGRAGTLYSRGGALYAPHARNIVLNDMVFDGNGALQRGKGGGASFSNDGSLTITDSSFTNNESHLGGGGMYTKGQTEVTLTRTTISGNSSTNFRGGGATFVSTNSNQDVNLNIIDSTISDNTAAAEGGGAAIVWQGLGSVSVTGSTVSGNSSKRNGSGLYIALADTVTITDTDITSNTYPTSEPVNAHKGGGAFIGNADDVTITGGSFTSNTARYEGGGLAVTYASSVSITGTTFDSNTSQSAGGGVWLYMNDDVELTDVTITNNYANAQGAGAKIIASGSSPLTISNSTLSGNDSHSSGGALSLYSEANYLAPFTINNSTITGNNADDKGGAIFAKYATLVLNQSTVSQNTAGYFDDYLYVHGGTGGVYLYGGSLMMSGTILSGNTNVTGSQSSFDADLAFDGGATVQSSRSILGAELDGVITDLGGTIFSDDPGLSALADNGGSTETMALKSDSVALDAGPDPVATFVGNQFDQRGDGYVRDVGTIVDIGAFEFGAGPPPTTTSTTSTTSTSTTSEAAPLDPDVVVPIFTG